MLLAIAAGAPCSAGSGSTGSVFGGGHINSRRSELFYWLTITFSQTLGTALGDWAADTQGLGYAGGMVLFGGLLALVAALHLTTRLSRTLLFWAAFILTRPLGAVVGDFLDKPLDHGGLALSRYAASLVLLIAIVACIALFAAARPRGGPTEPTHGRPVTTETIAHPS